MMQSIGRCASIPTGFVFPLPGGLVVRPRVLVICLLATLLGGLVGPSLSTAREVRLGVVDIEPLTFWQDGEAAGLFVELLAEVAAEHGWQLQFVPVTWDDGLHRLAAGDLDLMPTVAYSADRDTALDFTAEPVVTLWSQVYVQESSPLQNVTELNGRRVALMRGDMNAANFAAFTARFGVDYESVDVGTLDEAFAAVRDEWADAAVAPNLFGMVHAADYDLAASPILFAPFPVYYATTGGKNEDLLTALGSALRTWRTDPSDRYIAIVDRWLGQGSSETRMPNWALLALMGVGSLAVLLIFAIRSLEQRVQARTRDLEMSEQNFRAIFETAGDAIFLMRDGQFIECNPRTLEMFRCEREDILGHPPDDFSPPVQPDGRPSSEAARERIESARDGQRVSFEWQHRRFDGTVFDAEVTLNEFEVRGERYVQAFVRDVTRRKQLELDLRQAQKMEAIGTLAGGIAHDFNNILSVIMGYAELVRGDLDDRRDLQEYMGHITRASERARGLVQQILTFSRRSAENKRVVELAAIVEEGLELLRSSIPSTVEIRYDATTRGRVFADPTALHQIIMNLCTNAYHALGQDGGTIDVRLDEFEESVGVPRRSVSLVVADDGPGVPADVLPKIFEPYFTTKPADRGTGLGLAVVHGIIEDHDGRIEVDSQPGTGATFRVVLPATDAPLVAEDDEDTVSGQVASEHHVLVVDDEPAIVDVLARGLLRQGYRVTVFTDPNEALAALRAGSDAFDVLVTDMTMPGLTGAALARAVQELDPDLPILLCTGYSDGLTLDSAREMGARDLIMKPIAVNRLAHRIRMVLAGAPPR
jgi:PAS domain S-box-containing protein